MDEAAFHRLVERLRAVNEAIVDLDPALRAQAVAILQPYITGDPVPARQQDPAAGGSGGSTSVADDLDIDAFLDQNASDKPVENGLAIAAILYARHGKGPFKVKEFTDFAEQHNLVLPSQFHKSIGPVKRDGGEIFRRGGEGWQITVHGAKWIESTYGVKRGSQPKPE